MTIIIVLLAIAAGASTVLARNINSILAGRIGLVEGTFFNYVTGLLVSVLFLLISGEFLKLSSEFYKGIPFLAYLGGLVGVLVVSLSSIVTLKISAFYLTLIMFTGQLFAGIIIDYFTVGTLSTGKIVGGLLVVAGLMYNLKVDK
jgi:transporter family-2 protein